MASFPSNYLRLHIFVAMQYFRSWPDILLLFQIDCHCGQHNCTHLR